MEGFVSLLRRKEDLRFTGGVSEELIEACEKMLNLSFSTEYKEYLLAFGVATYEDHEFMGIGSSKRLDVVNNTMLERAKNTNAAEAYYVVERLDIDDVLIWQNREGEVFQSVGNACWKKIAESLAEYISE